MSSSVYPDDTPIPRCPYCDFHVTYPHAQETHGGRVFAVTWKCASCYRPFMDVFTSDGQYITITWPPEGDPHVPGVN